MSPAVKGKAGGPTLQGQNGLENLNLDDNLWTHVLRVLGGGACKHRSAVLMTGRKRTQELKTCRRSQAGIAGACYLPKCRSG